MNLKVTRHLLWKDFRMVNALAIAVITAIVVFNAALYFSSSAFQSSQDRLWFAYGTWILLPNLLALGAPAILVGSEEESGSLDWLRSLPATPRAIGVSKLIVGFATLFVALILSGVAFYAHWNSFSEQQFERLQAIGSLPEHLVLHYVGNALFSVTLLLVSFAMAYLFRSPVTALVAVVPVLGVGTWVFSVVSEQLFYVGYGSSPWWYLFSQHSVAFMGGAAAGAVLLVLIVQGLARRRLRSTGSRTVSVSVPEVVRDPFRPPSSGPAGLATGSWYGVALSQRTPGRMAALTWQAIRQMSVGLIGGSALLLFGLLLSWQSEEMGQPIGVLMGIFGFMIVSGLTFYGDSVRNRCLFLFDRGVSPTLVWLTRLLPTLTLTLAGSLVLVLFAWYYGEAPLSILGLLGMVLGFYALAQLASLCSPRPILVFFAAPVLFVFATFLLRPLLAEYPRATGVLLLSVPVLLFASWKLMPRWLSGRRDRSMNLVAGGYALLALAIPYALVLGGRWVTLPAKRTEWRDQMATRSLDPGRIGESTLSFSDPEFRATPEQLVQFVIDDKATTPRPDEEDPSGDKQIEGDQATSRRLINRLRTEVAEPSVLGGSVPLNELYVLAMRIPPELRNARVNRSQWGLGSDFNESYVDPELYAQAKDRFSEEQVLAAKALAKWSRVFRQKAMNSKGDYAMASSADQVDAILVELLDQLVELGVPASDMGEVLAALPSQAMRRQSRLSGLTNSWRRIEAGGLDSTFSRQRKVPRFAVERERLDRVKDEAFFTIDRQLQGNTLFAGNPPREQLEGHLIELGVAHLPHPDAPGRNPTFGERVHRAKVIDDRLDGYLMVSPKADKSGR